MNDLNGFFDRMVGFDGNKEIINLWFEIIFTKNLFFLLLKEKNIIIEKSDLNLFDEITEKAREMSKEFLLKKFPRLGITFNEDDEVKKNVD